MTHIEKKEFINKDITLNMSLFEYNAFKELARSRSKYSSKKEYMELLSDVLFSILERCHNKKQDLYFFYDMVKRNELKNYVIGAIRQAAHSKNAPYLAKKNQYNKHLDKNDYNFDWFASMNGDDLDELSDYKKHIVKKIYIILEPNYAQKVFGPDWKFFVKLLRDYIEDPKASYRSIALKYNITVSGVASHMKIIKEKLRKEIDYEKN